MKRTNDLREIPDELKNIIKNIIETRADFELAMVEQYSPWLVNAPNVDGRLFMAKIVSDELNHGWQLIRLLENFNVNTEKIQNARLGLHLLEVSNLPLFNWEDVISYVYLIDRAGLYQLRAIKDIIYEPLANLASSLAKEEEYHLHFSYNVLRSYEEKKRMQGALNFWFPRAVEMINQLNNVIGSKLYLEQLNIVDISVNEFIKSVNEELSKLGFSQIDPYKTMVLH
ncbi:ring oxydation complex/ phenylacetic acid degradation [Sulfolobus sp. E1]|nr:Phenylacetic acid catabolic protein [Sulfolobus sp. A20]TRM76745.1 ring oxydation complex/ phenylacetic acid degradation [Sulfolobus sp. E5]TRM78067.1 ring oxydation complex/ phenylacetic acid degradation [Sulfolobus sp. A20-N-F8]TRM82408.1 ring oxydation complex/ phenylacetic acid degradation [Sulfolobus sp. D5]TRM85361.1 ring oxydation complex/ phenylacetic acid degradation [Sulfolobus sp. F3]TRM88781.1 ring oxydation complex/ phenylacetic acid degradation [Sulfolobus sp. C3]TRN00933.1 r